MTSSFSTNNSRPTSSRRRNYSPKKYKSPTIRQTPEQKKQDKLSKLRDQVAKLRKQKAELRTRAQQQKKNLQAAEFRAKLDAIDSKITQKMQQMRDTASNVFQKVKDVAVAPAVATKRVWDDWEI